MSPVLIDITGRSDIVNLNHVRSLRVKKYGKGEGMKMGLELVYANGDKDDYMVPYERWYVLEGIILDLMPVAA